jgi:hypothetical protein
MTKKEVKKDKEIPLPVMVGVGIVVIALAVVFGMQFLKSTDPGVPVELAEMQAEAEAKRSPGYGKPAPVPGSVPTQTPPPSIEGASPGRVPNAQGGY